jgi:DNA-binding transcriptional regulator YdaS (Cro superfamily)
MATSPLEKYLDEHGITLTQFAHQIGCSTSRVWQLLNGRGKPSLKLIVSIERATNGEVTFEDWVSDAA